LLRLLRTYWFLLGIGMVLCFARWAPALGRGLEDHYATKIAVVIFSVSAGMSVTTANIAADLKDWKTHGLIQGYNLALTPLFIYLTSFWLTVGPLKQGVFLVAVVPTTLSSCVAYTAAARGRISCALLNSVGGNLIGVFISPLLLALMIGSGQPHGFVAAGRTILDLCLLVLAPLVGGQLCHIRLPRFREWAAPYLPYVGQSCVLILMLCAFSKSMDKLAAQLGTAWQVFAYLASAHVLLFAALGAYCRRAGYARDRTAAALFCGTQKTMALGLPMAYSFFAANAALGLIVLPLVFYHCFQLIFGSIVIAYWARRPEAGIR